MISFALTVARKDLLLTFTRGSGLVQGLLLGLLLLFVFSLSQGVGERMSPQGAGAVFWLGSAFCQVLIFNTLYALEEANGVLACCWPRPPYRPCGWARPWPGCCSCWWPRCSFCPPPWSSCRRR